MGLCELTVSEGVLCGCWHSWGCLWQSCFFQDAGVGGRVDLFGCLLDPQPLCETAFHRGCCEASGEQHIHRHCDAFGLHLEGTAGLGGLSAAFINHGPVSALQAASC